MRASSRNDQLERQIRQRGWTRREVADAVNQAHELLTGRAGAYSEERVRRLVRGEITWPHPHYRRALEHVFGVAATELGLFNGRRTRAEPPAARMRPGGAGRPPEAGQTNRRDVMKAITLLTTVPPAMITDVNAPDGLERIAGAVSAPRRADAVVLDTIETIVDQAKLQDDRLGPRAAIGTVLTQAHLTEALLADAGSAQRPRLLSLRSRIGSSIGWQSYDLGHAEAATGHFQIARAAADECGDHAAGALAMAEWSCMAVDTDSPLAAADLAAGAEVRASDTDDPRLRAHTAAVLAVALARLGCASETRSALNRAGRYDVAEVADPADSLAYFCTPAHLARMRARALRSIGDLDAALDAASESVALQPRRDLTSAHILLGALYLDTGRLDAAVETIIAGLDAGAGPNSPRVTTRLRATWKDIRRLAPGSAPVRKLDQRLAESRAA
ncbi:hypothetical protein [Nocardia huaxiensis]|uniref:Uncharacterized protein n=1 Tax=Nocardia huaxiensis TaxID=2755382 RepID=A0A7D6Z201_9NOCA|nr:hypothetical protein [Nocardia huaxiensis]QLY28804.1 hypothetical protein H0264_26200 [Nocardia huaxiensis]UFS97720.1 hypothetical protein LPY97_07400 [Nocardia huaxiensis]